MVAQACKSNETGANVLGVLPDPFVASVEGPEVAWGSRLQRTPSRVQITSDSVYRLPQTEIKVVHTIGEGTFGEVVLATNSVFGKIAVKWLKVTLPTPNLNPDPKS